MIEWIGIKFIKEIIRIMDFDFSVKLMTEFFGTALLLILGNGAVANVELKGTKVIKADGLSLRLDMGWG